MNSSTSKHFAKVLLIETDPKIYEAIRLALASSKVSLTIVSGADEVKKIPLVGYELLLCELSFVVALKASGVSIPKMPMLVFANPSQTDLFLKLRNYKSMTHFVSFDFDQGESAHWQFREMVNKILRDQVFGLSRYFSQNFTLHSRLILGSEDRRQANYEALIQLRSQGVRSGHLDRIQLVIEELLMNAIYDAPVDTAGNALYNHLSRRMAVLLEKDHCPTLRLAYDGHLLGVSVEDPFGSLRTETIAEYLGRWYHKDKNGEQDRRSEEISGDERGEFWSPKKESKGGAGRGLHQIVENADLAVFSVKVGVKTESLALFGLDNEASPRKIPNLQVHFISK